MPKPVKALIALAIVALVVFLTVFGLAKAKVIFINEWFVNRSASTIGVDVSAYQGEVDMPKLRDQDVAFVYIKATEGSSHVDDRFAVNYRLKKCGRKTIATQTCQRYYCVWQSTTVWR